jgi:transcription termination factor NusB
MSDVTKQVNYIITVTGAAQARQEVEGVAGAATQAGQAAGTGSGGAATAMSGLSTQLGLATMAGSLASQAITEVVSSVKRLISDAMALTVEMADLADAMGFIYADAAPGLAAGLDALSASTGYARTELYGISRDIGQMVVPLGVASGAAADMAQNLTTASADAAAALGLELSEAAGLVEQALRGSSRGARQLGIDISEAAVQAELYAMGINEAASAVDEATRIQARYNIIMEATSRYQGAAAAEMDTLEGKQRALSTAYEDMAVELGDRLAPVAQIFLDSLTDFMPTISQLIDLVAAVVTAGFGPCAISMSLSAELTSILTDLWEQFGDIMGISVTPLQLVSDVLEWINDKIEKGGAILRVLLGVKEEEVVVLGQQASALDTLYTKQGSYNDMISTATIAELEYATALLTRMNILGIMDPAIQAATDRLEELRAEVQSLTDLAESKRQEAKDAGLTGGASPAGGGGGGGPTPAQTAEEQKAAQVNQQLRALVQLDRQRAQIQTDAAQAEIDALNEQRELAAELYEMIADKQNEYLSEQQEAAEKRGEETAEMLVDTYSGIFDNMENLDEYVEDMIKRWAAELLKAFALQSLTDAFTGGLGGKLMGAGGGGKLLGK